MTVEHKDLSNNLIEVGHHVVYAALWDRSAVLKYGIVVALKERPGNIWDKKAKTWKDGSTPTLRVISVDRSWDDNWELQNSGKVITLGFTDRCLAVPPALVPDEARALLDEAYAKVVKQ